MDNQTNQREKGVILIMAVITLVLIGIFLPTLVYLVRQESKWTLKQKKSTVAFHMAEAGADRGIWKLQESDEIWNFASTGAVIAGYNFDVVYISTDVSGTAEGEYKVKLTTGTVSGRVKVQSIGRDTTNDEVRSVEVELSKSPLEAGLQLRSGLTYKSGTRVHWGPIICYGDIDLPNSPDDDSAFPRKVAKGSIDERPPTSASGPHGDTAESWDGTYDHWCHASSLTNPPTIDLDAYREIAKQSSIPPIAKDSGSGAATAVPAGSGYFPSDGISLKIPGGGNSQPGDAYVFNNSTSVIFVEKTYSFSTRNKYSQLVVNGLIMPNATLSVNGDTKIPDRVVQIPEGAQKEYLYDGTHGDATEGWSDAQGQNTLAFSAVGEGNNFTVADVLIHGYMYFKNVSNSGTDVNVVGVLDMAQATNPQSIVIYYDVNVATGILTANLSPTQLSWREVQLTW